MRLLTFLDAEYAPRRLGLGQGALLQLRIAVRLFDRWLSRPACLADLTNDSLLAWMRWLANGRAVRTVNDKRASLISLWRLAYAQDRVERWPCVPRMKEPRRIPTAWTTAEVGRILEACRTAREIPGWTTANWCSLVLVIYDTALRLGCLLEARREQVAGDSIWIPAENQKGKVETCHRLHPQTMEELAACPLSDMLFPWPRHPKCIASEFRAIVRAAGLPATRRDLFQKLRRTSYTLVYVTLGPRAATEHAAHTSDLSRYYLDPRHLPHVPVTSVLPRP